MKIALAQLDEALEACALLKLSEAQLTIYAIEGTEHRHTRLIADRAHSRRYVATTADGSSATVGEWLTRCAIDFGFGRP